MLITEDFVDLETPTGAMRTHRYQPTAGGPYPGLVLFSAFGALAGIVLTGPRVYLAMARDGMLFRWLGEVHPVYRTPHRALLLQAIWSSVLVATGTFRVLFTRVIYTEWIFFGLLAVGVVVLRRRPGYSPPFRMPWAPVLPVVFAASCAAVTSFSSTSAFSTPLVMNTWSALR